MSDVGGNVPENPEPQRVSPEEVAAVSALVNAASDPTSSDQRPRFGEYAVDERPRPEYGEYATPEEQRAAIKQPIDYGDGDEDAAEHSRDARGFGGLFGQAGDPRGSQRPDQQRPDQQGQAGQIGQWGQPGQDGQGGYGVPWQAGQPGQPGASGQPGAPGQPGVGGWPGPAGQPNQPGQPGGQWGQPGQGGGPGQWGQPGQPSQWGQPAQPGSGGPGQPNGPAGPVAPWQGAPGQVPYVQPYPQGQYPQGSYSQPRVRRPPGPFDRVIAMLFLAYGLWTVVTNCISAFSGGYAHVAESFSSWFTAMGEKVPTIPDWLGIAIALVELATWCVTAGITISRIQRRRRAVWIPVFGVVAAGILTAIVLAIGFVSDPTLMQSLVPTAPPSSGT